MILSGPATFIAHQSRRLDRMRAQAAAILLQPRRGRFWKSQPTTVACGSWWDLTMRASPSNPRTLGANGGTGEPCVEAVEVEEDDRRRVERQRLADDQAADDRIAERLADLRRMTPSAETSR